MAAERYAERACRPEMRFPRGKKREISGVISSISTLVNSAAENRLAGATAMEQGNVRGGTLRASRRTGERSVLFCCVRRAIPPDEPKLGAYSLNDPTHG